jgi:menaquinol-cytochrome c reductase iron-sulfur subunit
VQFKGDHFHCPCHNSQFDLDGSTTNKKPPRGLDTLEVKVEGNDVLVRYQTFIAGRHEKIPV